MNSDPDLTLAGLCIWVLDRPFSDASNGFDENWLTVRATIQGRGSSVTTEGAILMTHDFKSFRDELAAMHAALAGKASLSGYEPNLRLALSMDDLGRVPGEIEITADHLNERHRYEFAVDQSFLPGLVASCDEILELFPVINSAL